MSITARQLCRWAAIQHPETEIVGVGVSGDLGSTRLTSRAEAEELNTEGLEIVVEGSTASAFEED